MKHLLAFMASLILAGCFWPALFFFMPKKKRKQIIHPKAK